MQAALSHYRVLDQIGQGGMGVVYRAHDERLDRDVALKVLPPGTLVDESTRRQFRKEALLCPSSQTSFVHDFDTRDGTDFLVEELIPGLSLGEMLLSGPLPEREILNLGSRARQRGLFGVTIEIPRICCLYVLTVLASGSGGLACWCSFVDQPFKR